MAPPWPVIVAVYTGWCNQICQGEVVGWPQERDPTEGRGAAYDAAIFLSLGLQLEFMKGT